MGCSDNMAHQKYQFRKEMVLKKVFKNPVFYAIILLSVYILIVTFFSTDNLSGDEPRYIQYAKNLIAGFYSPPPPEISLWNGPGYPLFLCPFLIFKLPLISIRYANAVLYFISVLLLYRGLKNLGVSYKTRLICCGALACAFPYYLFYILNILTEVYVLFLISLFSCLVLKIKSDINKIGLIIITGLVLSQIMLTKVLFAYVCIVILFGLVFIKLLWSKKIVYLSILITAFAFTSPYLIYTYNLTGKIFYWTNSGGLSLYWMSTPYQDEMGDWYNSSFMTVKRKDSLVLNPNDFYKNRVINSRDSAMRRNHGVFFSSLTGLSPVQKDLALKAKALENIRKYPGKYIRNWIANNGRLFFHYPFSYRDQTINTYLVLIPSFILLLFFVLTLFPSCRFWHDIPIEMKILMAFSLTYLGGSGFLSAYSRFFMPVIPVFILWIGYVYDNFIEIRFSKKQC